MLRIKNRYQIFFGKKTWLICCLLMAVVWSCEPWDETAEVSHVSSIPRFEIIGDELMSFIVDESAADYIDEGVNAFSGNTSLDVFYDGEVDLTKVGVYTITYFAKNSDGIESTAERIIAVTNSDVSNRDLSGEYAGANFGNRVTEMTVTKINDKGFYESNDIMGFDGAEMRGKFVDLGDHELVLIHGKGDFGRYADTEGEYTLSSLSWIVKLTDAPYNGLELPILWSRVRE